MTLSNPLFAVSRSCLLAFFLIFLAACQGGDGGEGATAPASPDQGSGDGSTDDGSGDGSDDGSDDGSSTGSGDGSGDGDNNDDGGDGVSNPPAGGKAAFETPTTTARFLTQATFGPTKADLSRLTGTEASDWIRAQFSAPESLITDHINEYRSMFPDEDEDDVGWIDTQLTTFGFWKNALAAEDQLRQRVAFALSEILVVSNAGGDQLEEHPETVGYFQDVLIRNAFGNYRTILQEVTYTPAMGFYLTYMGNQKGDAETGRMPDENYAREIMQLFTIGLQELNMDGTPVIGGNGQAIETYDNNDITGLAKVFTGLSADCDYFIDEDPGYYCDGQDGEERSLVDRPMKMFDEQHSPLEKTFLGYTIPAGTGGDESIRLALDHIFAQPSLAPFISRQLIQRLVTSHPSGDYIRRVATAFETGSYTLPDGSDVGAGSRGDMRATISAILFDDEARQDPSTAPETYGKVREPILRFTSWARMFEALTVSPEFNFTLWDTSPTGALAQHPYRSPSVFNFFRPGYVAPGTETGSAGLTMPEMQLINTGSMAGYVNFMTYFVFNNAKDEDPAAMQEFFDEAGLDWNADRIGTSFIANYDDELELATDPAALIDHLDSLLTFSALSAETRAGIVETLENIPLSIEGDDDYEGEDMRVKLAILMLITSPDFIVQR